jgi:succinate dehydrogenase hydrophobic anchor subunit
MAQSTITQSQATQASSGTSWLWFLKQVSGPFILIIIIVHFIVNHLIGEGGLLSYDQIVNYYKIWIVPIMEGLFLILVVGHSLLGLRSILMDLQPSRGLTRLINWAFLAFGLVVIVYGIWLIGKITQVG